MFATREIRSVLSRRNLATGETSIDVKGCIADTVFAAKLGGRNARLMFFQNTDDLFFKEPGSLHRLYPLIGNRLTSKRGTFRGAGQTAPSIGRERLPFSPIYDASGSVFRHERLEEADYKNTCRSFDDRFDRASCGHSVPSRLFVDLFFPAASRTYFSAAGHDTE